MLRKAPVSASPVQPTPRMTPAMTLPQNAALMAPTSPANFTEIDSMFLILFVIHFMLMLIVARTRAFINCQVDHKFTSFVLLDFLIMSLSPSSPPISFHPLQPSSIFLLPLFFFFFFWLHSFISLRRLPGLEEASLVLPSTVQLEEAEKRVMQLQADLASRDQRVALLEKTTAEAQSQQQKAQVPAPVLSFYEFVALLYLPLFVARVFRLGRHAFFLLLLVIRIPFSLPCNLVFSLSFSFSFSFFFIPW
jgi:hypothetical protein